MKVAISLEVDGSGTTSLSESSLEPSTVYRSFLRSEVTLMADGIPGASALARGEFANGDHGARLDYLDWTFTLPDGFIITDCGNGTAPF
ncbi:MAG: hypothetical protein ACT4OM_04690 [Actinomycetota bacterium]